MTEKAFLNDLAEIILSEMRNPELSNLQNDICRLGHFHYRVFNPKRLFHQLSYNFIRFLMNMAMGMTPGEFRFMCNRLVERIIEAAESYESDAINAEHHKTKYQS